MHLINTNTYEVRQYVNPRQYAILSHTWHDEEEVLHQEFLKDITKAKLKKGFRKVEYLCKQAVRDELEFAWIDTVCIDKRSSAELSEAINSMFVWYREAEVCYVYLDDVDQVSEIPKCRWITRGWTLQELLAPGKVRFYNKDWDFIGDKVSLAADLARYTHIDQIALTHPDYIPHYSAATRMSWASSRQTTRIEDMAYCLLGLFDVNMPLLYGERDKAFIRLQEQILKQHQDITILAFDRKGLDFDESVLLASSPAVFGKMPKVVREGEDTQCEFTSRGMQLHVRLLERSEPSWPRFLAILNCRFEFETEFSIALPMIESSLDTGDRVRCFLVDNSSLIQVKHYPEFQPPYQDVLLLYRTDPKVGGLDLESLRFICSIKADQLLVHGYEILYAEPDRGVNGWSSNKLVSEIVTPDRILITKFAFVHQEHNEAFIIMIATERTNRGPKPFDQRIWYNVEAKPLETDHTSWLKQRKMYSVLEQPDFFSEWRWIDPSIALTTPDESKLIDGIRWQVAGRLKAGQSSKETILLHSQQCYGKLCMEISESNPRLRSILLSVTPVERRSQSEMNRSVK